MIKQAAIRQDGKVYTVPRPGGHGDVVKEMAALDVVYKGTADGEQGFITEDGRFLDRIVANKIAKECGQIRGIKLSPRLSSVDLW